MPLVNIEVEEVSSKKEFYDIIVTALKQIDASDRKTGNIEPNIDSREFFMMNTRMLMGPLQ